MHCFPPHWIALFSHRAVPWTRRGGGAFHGIFGLVKYLVKLGLRLRQTVREEGEFILVFLQFFFPRIGGEAAV